MAAGALVAALTLVILPTVAAFHPIDPGAVFPGLPPPPPPPTVYPPAEDDSPHGRRLTMSFGSGHVITSPRVSLVFYGPNWDPYNKDVVRSFLYHLASSDWWKISTEYTGDDGTVVGNSLFVDGDLDILGYPHADFQNFYGVGVYNLTDVTAYVDFIVSTGLLTVAAPSAPHLIMILGDDRTVSPGQCLTLCGWHQHGMRTYGFNNYYVSWIGNPKVCADSYGVTCGGGGAKSPNNIGIWGQYIDAQLSVVAHEITEWVTNPDGQQWWDRNDKKENGDKCAYQYGYLWPTCNGQLANEIVGGDPYTIQMNYRLNVGCVNAAATPVPHPSCSSSNTPPPTPTRSITRSNTRTRTTTPTYSTTATHSIGASPSQTASASYTATMTATSTASNTATPTCFFTPMPRPQIPYAAFDPSALIGVCTACGAGGGLWGGDPGPAFASFSLQGGAGAQWAQAGPALGLRSSFASWGGGVAFGGGGGAGRRAQNQPSPSPGVPPGTPTCFPVNGSSVVPWPNGDGFTTVCVDANGGFFAADMLWDQTADVATMPADVRVLRGWAPTAIARIGGLPGRAYAVARAHAYDACPGTSACGDAGGLTLVIEAPAPPDARRRRRRRLGGSERRLDAIVQHDATVAFEYGGTVLTGMDVVAVATYSPDAATDTGVPPTDEALIFATRGNSDVASSVFLVPFAALAAFAGQPDDGVTERRFGGLKRIAAMPVGVAMVSALATVPHNPVLLLAVYDKASGASFLELRAPNSDGVWVLVTDATGAHGWGGAPNPLPLPDPNAVLGGGPPTLLRRRLNNGQPLYAQSMSAWARGVGRFGPCNTYVIGIAATQASASNRRQLRPGDAGGGGAIIVYDAGAQSWVAVPATVSTDGAGVYSSVLPPPRARWAPTPSNTAVPRGGTPPASATAPPTQGASGTPSLPPNAPPSPTRRPWNVTRPWPLGNILVTRVGPSSQGATDGTLTAPVFVDEYLTTKARQTAPVTSTAMPLMLSEADNDGPGRVGGGIDVAAPQSAVCTLPLLPPGPCAEAHGQTALDGSELAFVCLRALEGTPAAGAAAADRVLVTMTSGGVDLSTPLADAAAPPGARACSVAQRVDAAAGRLHYAAGADGMDLVDASFTLTRPAPILDGVPPALQHTLFAPGFATYNPATPTLFASTSSSFMFASAFEADGSVTVWSTLAVPLTTTSPPSLRGFAAYSDTDARAAQLWACDTGRGILHWGTMWEAGAGPLSSSWSAIGGAKPVGAPGGCQGMLVRDEGATAVSLQLYVTTTPLRGSNALYKADAMRGTLTLLAMSAPGAVFRGVFVPPTTPNSRSPSQSLSASRTASRTPRPSRTPPATPKPTGTPSRTPPKSKVSPTPSASKCVGANCRSPSPSPCVNPLTGGPCASLTATPSCVPDAAGQGCGGQSPAPTSTPSCAPGVAGGCGGQSPATTPSPSVTPAPSKCVDPLTGAPCSPSPSPTCPPGATNCV